MFDPKSDPVDAALRAVTTIRDELDVMEARGATKADLEQLLSIKARLSSAHLLLKSVLAAEKAKNGEAE